MHEWMKYLYDIMRDYDQYGLRRWHYAASFSFAIIDLGEMMRSDDDMN